MIQPEAKEWQIFEEGGVQSK